MPRGSRGTRLSRRILPMATSSSSRTRLATLQKGCPKANNAVTPATLFRGNTYGDLVGPYISQFLLRPVPFGTQYVEQRMRTVLPGIDFLTQSADWLNAQNGVKADRSSQFDSTRRYI